MAERDRYEEEAAPAEDDMGIVDIEDVRALVESNDLRVYLESSSRDERARLRPLRSRHGVAVMERRTVAEADVVLLHIAGRAEFQHYEITPDYLVVEGGPLMGEVYRCRVVPRGLIARTQNYRVDFTLQIAVTSKCSVERYNPTWVDAAVVR